MTHEVPRPWGPPLRGPNAIGRWSLVPSFVFSGLMLLAAPLAATTACEDVSGVYDVIVDVPGGGPTEIELDLSQEECNVTGFVTAQTKTAIQNGVVDESTASFTFLATNDGTGDSLEIAWVITVAGDMVTGTFSHDLFGSLAVTGNRRPGRDRGTTTEAGPTR